MDQSDLLWTKIFLGYGLFLDMIGGLDAAFWKCSVEVCGLAAVMFWGVVGCGSRPGCRVMMKWPYCQRGVTFCGVVAVVCAAFWCTVVVDRWIIYCVFYQNKSGAVASDGGVAVVILAPSDIAWWGRHDLFWHINVKQRLAMVPLGWRWDDRYSWLGFIEHRWYVTIVSHAGEYISTSGHGWTV